jgi:NTE family protein
MKPIRVAFSGSGFKVPAHAGALQAILDCGYRPIEVSGTSGGSICAALYACGMSAADMKQIALTHDWSDMMTFTPLSIFNLGYCNGKNLLSWMIQNTGGKTFAELPIGLTAVASNLANNRDFIWSAATTPDAPVALAIRASTSIPFVFEPVRYQDAILQDGGMIDNIPVDKLVRDEVPRIGIQLVSNDQPLKPNVKYGVGTLASRIIDLMLSACESAHVSIAQMAGAHMAFVETGYASTLDRNMPIEIRQRLFNDGYAATKAALAGIAEPAPA